MIVCLSVCFLCQSCYFWASLFVSLSLYFYIVPFVLLLTLITSSSYSYLLTTSPIRLLRTGYKSPLEADDVFRLNPRDESRSVVPPFERAWMKELSRVRRLNRRHRWGDCPLDRWGYILFISVVLPNNFFWRWVTVIASRSCWANEKLSVTIWTFKKISRCSNLVVLLGCVST